MAIGPRLDIRQSQSLVMTPQLQQAIKLLQFSSMELADYVEGELEQNPILERDESDPGGATSRETAEDQRAQDSATQTNEDGQVGPDAHEVLGQDAIVTQTESPLDADYQNEFDGEIAGPGSDYATDSGPSAGLSMSDMPTSNRNDYTAGENPLEATVSEAPSLVDHLQEQLMLDVEDVQHRIIALHLIDLLDEAGYLHVDLEALAHQLGCDEETLELVLDRVQHFDPPGVFARSLGECLALQLRDQNRLDPAIQALLDNLDMLASQNVKGLKKICGVDDEDLADMVQEIRALDPKPGLRFAHEITQPVIPDILMRSKEDGSWAIELNPETLPRVLVNETYYTEISKTARSREDKEYLSEQFQSANWLVKSLHQRATTIMKVGSEIIRQQDAFFRFGVSFLKPLVLRDIAEAIDMHESTISRVTTNKYIATPRGLYELKYFFTSSIGSTSGGDAHSAEAVKFRIKELIDAESPKKILSDDKIVALLKAQGMDIARRTVAKYREAMNISSSVQRRREKNKKI